MSTRPEYSSNTDECDPPLGKEVHDEMRQADVEIGGKETTTKDLMRPQTGEGIDG
jgi:hypothetical protein